MRSRINLATRPVENQRGFWVTISLLLLAALPLTMYALTAGVLTWQLRMTTRTRLSELQRERRALREDLNRLAAGLQEPATQELLAQNEYLNRIIRQKAFSWNIFFDRLAKNLPRNARVLSVSPILHDDGRVEVLLRMGGRTPGAIHEFMKRLEEGEHFSQVVMKSQEQRQNAGGDDPVTAQLSTVYLEGD